MDSECVSCFFCVAVLSQFMSSSALEIRRDFLGWRWSSLKSKGGSWLGGLSCWFMDSTALLHVFFAIADDKDGGCFGIGLWFA